MKRRVAIVGCGGISQVHARVLGALESVELCAFADCRPDRAEKLAEQYGGERAGVYGSLREMLAAEKPHVVHICTPHHLHVPMALEVLGSGGSVFMEKPPAISSRQLGQLEQALAQSNGKLGVCFQNRYNPSTRKVDELLREERLGEVRGGRVFVTWNRDADYYRDSDWHGSWNTEGGGALINQSIHALDLLLRWLGEPDVVEASMGNHHLRGVAEVEDVVEAFLEFPGGKRACFYATTAYVSDAPVQIELACEQGSIRVEEERVTVRHSQGDEEVYLMDAGGAMGKAYWGSGHASCIGDFYHSLEEGIPYANDLASVTNTMQTVMRMYQSAGMRS